MPIDFRNRYRSMDDIAMRHSRCICGIKDEESGLFIPHRIDNVRGSLSSPGLIVRKLIEDESTIAINLDNPGLRLERPELVMANIKELRTNTEIAVWSSALPYRQVKRSLSPEMFKICNINFSRDIDIITDKYTRQSTYQLFHSFYNQEYPSYVAILEKIRNSELLSGAFSTLFALSAHPIYGIVLVYKDKIVGYIEEDRPILCSSFRYLQESLEETNYEYV